MEKTKEIKRLYGSILQNLELEPQSDFTINSLCNEQQYCVIFKIMFPFLENEIEALFYDTKNTGDKLQSLIEFLSFRVLTMDLSHISGQAISQGDIRHLSNFLQILLELSVLYNKQRVIPDSNAGSTPVDSEHSGEPYTGSVIGDTSRRQAQSNPDLNSQSQNEQFKKGTKKMTRIKSKRELIENNSSSKQVSNSKNNQMKAIEGNLLPVTQKQPRIITTDPNIATKLKQKQQQKHTEEEEEEEDQDQELISEVDLEFLQQVDQEQLEQLPEDHEVVQKYMRELQKIELLKMQQQSGGNIDDLIDVQIQIVKDSLKKMRSQAPVDEKETIDQLLKNKNAYKLFLKDYLKTYDGNKKKQSEQKQKVQQNQFRKVTKLKKEKEDLQKEFENEHLSMYYKMRDEKLNYLRKIHRIIFELEKRKIIDEKKDHLQVRRQQNVVARNALSSIENAYNDKISMLKEKLQSERKERHQASQAQKEILSKLERELRQDKLKQISELKDMWKQEKERFDYMIKDDGDLEKKILQIYKKY